jgi:hypothetical protein
MTHEGGSALGYSSLCCARILEAFTGERTGIDGPFLARWGTDFAAAVSAEAEDVVARCAGFLRDVPRPASSDGSRARRFHDDAVPIKE